MAKVIFFSKKKSEIIIKVLIYIVFQIPNPKTVGDPIIDYFDVKPSYGKLGESQDPVYGTIAVIEIQMYLSKKEQLNIDTSMYRQFFENYILKQYLNQRVTNWANDIIWMDFFCLQCTARGIFT